MAAPNRREEHMVFEKTHDVAKEEGLQLQMRISNSKKKL